MFFSVDHVTNQQSEVTTVSIHTSNMNLHLRFSALWTIKQISKAKWPGQADSSLDNNKNNIAFQLMMSYERAGQVLSLQSSLSCASL